MKLTDQYMKNYVKNYLKSLLNEDAAAEFAAMDNRSETPTAMRQRLFSEYVAEHGLTQKMAAGTMTPEETQAAMSYVTSKMTATASPTPAVAPTPTPAVAPTPTPEVTPAQTAPAIGRPTPEVPPTPTPTPKKLPVKKTAAKSAKPVDLKSVGEKASVQDLQRELVASGFLPKSPKSIDGIYGQQTQAARDLAINYYKKLADSVQDPDFKRVTNAHVKLLGQTSSAASAAAILSLMRTHSKGMGGKVKAVTTKRALLQEPIKVPFKPGGPIKPGTQQYSNVVTPPSSQTYEDALGPKYHLKPGDAGYGVFREGKVIFSKKYIQRVIKEELNKILKKKIRK